MRWKPTSRKWPPPLHQAGDLLMALRVMLVGAKFGPSFDIAEQLGREETQRRIQYALGLLA